MTRHFVAAICVLIGGAAVSSSHALSVQRLDAWAPSLTLAAGSGKVARDQQILSSVQEIMDSIVDPSADVIWNAVGTVQDKEGNHELLPQSAEEWHDVRRAAVRIIEGGNLLIMPREAAPPGTKSEAEGVELEPVQIAALIKKKRKMFNGFARALQSLGAEALRAADAKDGDQLLEIGARMEAVCESCHQTFWYPPQKQAARDLP